MAVQFFEALGQHVRGRCRGRRLLLPPPLLRLGVGLRRPRPLEPRGAERLLDLLQGRLRFLDSGPRRRVKRVVKARQSHGTGRRQPFVLLVSERPPQRACCHHLDKGPKRCARRACSSSGDEAAPKLPAAPRHLPVAPARRRVSPTSTTPAASPRRNPGRRSSAPSSSTDPDDQPQSFHTRRAAAEQRCSRDDRNNFNQTRCRSRV